MPEVDREPRALNQSHARIAHALPDAVRSEAAVHPLTSAILTHHLHFESGAASAATDRPQGDPHYVLIFCLSGVGRISVRETTFQMKAGMFLFVKPFEAYRYQACAFDPWSYYCVAFDGQLAPHYVRPTGSSCAPFVSSNSPLLFVEAFERILALYTHGYSQSNLTQASVATHQLIGEALRHTPSADPVSPSVGDRINRTMELIHRNLAMQVSIPDLAAQANLSRSQFVVQFRKRTGLSPRNYINRLRIAAACARLRATHDKIAQIAQDVGFADSFYFYRLFKQTVGCTPSEHRRINYEDKKTAGQSPAAFDRV